MSEWLRWQPGRQEGSDYRKMLLFRLWFFDLWLIDYPTGDGLVCHKDICHGKNHYRANLVLWGPTKAFYRYPAMPVKHKGAVYGSRLNVFRPDLDWHGVRPGFGRRIVLSLGWAI